MPYMLFSITLLVWRVCYTGHLTFLFLLWNLFLAIIPMYITHKLETQTLSTMAKWMYVAAWLLFFPNSMYIITDLFHLKERGDIPLWYDLLTLLSAGVNGVIMGFSSLYKIENWMAGFVKKQYRPAILFIVLLLCGYGIYLGRYERWNSWDIVAQPFSLCSNMAGHIIHPFRNKNIWVLSVAFATWMYMLYRHATRLLHVK
jgi:uncharacterized membrane protein